MGDAGAKWGDCLCWEVVFFLGCLCLHIVGCVCVGYVCVGYVWLLSALYIIQHTQYPNNPTQ